MRNVHKVQLKQWRKWSPEARGVFNYVYGVMVADQRIFLHPKSKGQSKLHWKTTAWNAAWIAADAATAAGELEMAA